MGNQDLWWYVGGEYGGGAWTVEREGDFSDRIDINDIRVMLGLEWGQAAIAAAGAAHRVRGSGMGDRPRGGVRRELPGDIRPAGLVDGACRVELLDRSTNGADTDEQSACELRRESIAWDAGVWLCGPRPRGAGPAG